MAEHPEDTRKKKRGAEARDLLRLLRVVNKARHTVPKSASYMDGMKRVETHLDAAAELLRNEFGLLSSSLLLEEDEGWRELVEEDFGSES